MLIKFVNCPTELEKLKSDVEGEAIKFTDEFSILETDTFRILVDQKTGAFFSECNISAKEIVEMGTIDVSLDPDEQSDYRANRDFQEGHSAYIKMQNDANQKRVFSNIVCEYSTSYQTNTPLKIIGGQHRYLAIEDAFKNGINEYHGVKVYFLLDKEQRLDVQLISNTNISVSTDLLDRMMETVKGPELRDFCQITGLLNDDEDFADKKQRGGQLTVRAARTFVINFFKGKQIPDRQFDDIDTTPYFPKTGGIDEEWENIRCDESIWENEKLIKAAKEFAKLNQAQKEYFRTNSGQSEFSDKANSYSVLAGWAFVAGVLHKNEIRLNRHFELAEIKKTDPLSSVLLAKAKHKTDPENYRGLGTRNDTKERGRLAELFFLQADRGNGFTKSIVDLALKKYHAKQSNLEVKEAEKKLEDE